MADGQLKRGRVAGYVKPSGASATTIATFQMAANERARFDLEVNAEPSLIAGDGEHYTARWHFNVMYAGGTLTLGTINVTDADGTLTSGVTFALADGGSGLVQIQASSATNVGISVQGDVSVMEQSRV